MRIRRFLNWQNHLVDFRSNFKKCTDFARRYTINRYILKYVPGVVHILRNSPQNVKINQNLNIDFLHDDNTFPIGKVKKEY